MRFVSCYKGGHWGITPKLESTTPAREAHVCRRLRGDHRIERPSYRSRQGIKIHQNNRIGHRNSRCVGACADCYRDFSFWLDRKSFNRRRRDKLGVVEHQLKWPGIFMSDSRKRLSSMAVSNSRKGDNEDDVGTMKVISGKGLLRSESKSSRNILQSVNAGRYVIGRSVRNFFSRPELVAISLVYLAQGLLGLSRLAVFTFFKDDLNLDPATVGILTGFTMVPWVIKPVYGFLSDSVPIWGYKRRSYLILCGILGASSWISVAGPVDSASAVVVALTLGSMSTACADVVADSIVVELSRGKPQSMAGSLQSLCWASASAGSVLSAYFSGALVESYGPKPVFLLTASFPMLVALAAAVIPEKKSSLDVAMDGSLDGLLPALKSQAFALWEAIRQKSILCPAIFVFLWQATPSADTAMLYFETNELGFSTEFLGRIRYEMITFIFTFLQPM